MLSKPKDQIDWIFINYLLGGKVLQAVSRNLHEHELMTGQSGYLYALLLIEKKMREVDDKKRLDLHLKTLHIIIATTVKLITSM
jgi:hypothetical protein